MQQMDLKDYTPDPLQAQKRDVEYSLQDAMRDQWKSDLATIKGRGVFPDWMGEPAPLSKDKARLLEVLYDQGSVIWRDKPCKNNRNVTEQIGLNNMANAKATIDSAIKMGLVDSRLYRGDPVLTMTHEGEFALADWKFDNEVAEL